jgi:hypothetical protein
MELYSSLDVVARCRFDKAEGRQYQNPPAKCTHIDFHTRTVRSIR